MTLLRSDNPQLIGLRAIDPNKFREHVIKVFQHTDGNISKAAKLMKVDRSSVNRWLAADPQLQTALNQIRRGGT
jgi:ActR/RegA family two-component response regulator